MTQEQLALKVGVSQGLIAQLESPNFTRKKSPRLTLIIQLAEALSVCVNDLIHFHCNSCHTANTCTKRRYVEKDDKNFFENNLKYYL
jgi:DNA-binding XRE family transcriptional regulator